MMKKIRMICALLLLLSLFTVALCACRTSANWRNQYNDTDQSSIDTVKANGSEKYIVYAALKTVQNELEEDEYAFMNSTDVSNDVTPTAYAVVGYTGLVAELVIPASYNDKPVKQVMVCSSREVEGVSKYAADYVLSQNGSDYTGQYSTLANNTIVTSIVFGENVEYIGAGVCHSMINLTTVTLTNANVALGGYAFGNCVSLATVSLTAVNGTYTDATGTAFSGCPYIPPAVVD